MQVIKYLHASTVTDVLTKLETLELTNRSDALLLNSGSDTDPDTDVSPVASPASQSMVSRQLFSSPQVRRKKPKTRDNQFVPRKKPRRRKRKENGGYDMSPTATYADETYPPDSDPDPDHVDIQC